MATKVPLNTQSAATKSARENLHRAQDIERSLDTEARYPNPKTLGGGTTARDVNYATAQKADRERDFLKSRNRDLGRTK